MSSTKLTYRQQTTVGRLTFLCAGPILSKGGGLVRSSKTAGQLSLSVFYAVVGAIVGSVVGVWLGKYWAPLAHNYLVVGSGVNHPWAIDLHVVGIQVGAWLRLNLGGILGLLLGVVVARRR